MNGYRVLISGKYNAFNEGFNNAGVYMASGLYVSETFKLPIYIGSSENLKHRIEKEHIDKLNINKHPHNIPLQYAWNKHGGESGFVWLLLEICPEEQTLIRENYYLQLYKPFASELGGFNVAKDALSPMKGRKHTKEAVEKIKVALSERVISEETRKKLSASKSKENNPNFGKSVRSDVRKKISKSISGEKHPNFGKPRSKETKDKIRKKAKNQDNSSYRKPVKQIDPKTGLVIRIWSHSGEVDSVLGKNISKHIASVCLGTKDKCGYVRKTAGGFIWAHATSEEYSSWILSHPEHVPQKFNQI